MIATNIWFWFGFVGFILAMLSLDLGVFHRTPHEVRASEAAIYGRFGYGLAQGDSSQIDLAIAYTTVVPPPVAPVHPARPSMRLPAPRS